MIIFFLAITQLLHYHFVSSLILLLIIVDDAYDVIDFLVCHYRAHRQAYLMIVDLLGDGITPVIPLLIRLLFVRRYGIMNDRADAVRCQICLKAVSVANQNRKNMIYIIAVYRPHGKLDGRIANTIDVSIGNLYAAGIVLI